MQMQAKDNLVPQKLALFNLEECLTESKISEANLEANDVDCPEKIRYTEFQIFRHQFAVANVSRSPFQMMEQKIYGVLRFLLFLTGIDQEISERLSSWRHKRGHDGRVTLNAQ